MDATGFEGSTLQRTFTVNIHADCVMASSRRTATGRLVGTASFGMISMVVARSVLGSPSGLVPGLGASHEKDEDYSP